MLRHNLLVKGITYFLSSRRLLLRTMSFSMARPPLQGIGNYAHPRSNKISRPPTSSKAYPFISVGRTARSYCGYPREKIPGGNVVKGMIPEAPRHVSINRPPKKKQRTSTNEPPSIASLKRNQPAWTSSIPAKKTNGKTSTSPSSEILIKEWLVLPQSQYGIDYELGTSTTHARIQEMSGISIL